MQYVVYYYSGKKTITKASHHKVITGNVSMGQLTRPYDSYNQCLLLVDYNFEQLLHCMHLAVFHQYCETIVYS